MATPNKQDSNTAGLYIAEEESLGVLPTTPEWWQMEPNSYQDFGAEVSKVARSTINATRKRRKGGTTDIDAMGGFEHDMVMRGMLRTLRGFFVTDGKECGTSDPLNLATKRACTAVDDGDDDYTFDGALTGAISAGDLVYADGFGEAGNNGLKVVDTGVTTTVVPVTTGLTAEASPPAAARLRVVGHQFAAGDVSAGNSGDLLYLNSTATAFDTDLINVGDHIFIGGDTTATQFGTLGTGYARVVAVTAATLTLTDFTGTMAIDSGATKTIQLFYATTSFRDEPVAADISKRTYQLERTLGSDDDGVQSEYAVGCTANELSLSIPLAEKMTASCGFVALDSEQRTGAQGVKSGNRTSAESESFVNTSTDIYVTRLLVAGQTNLVGYIESMDVNLNNGATPNKAVGVQGAFDYSLGDFEVGGSVNAYFNTVAAMAAVRNNSDVSFQCIAASDNEGIAIGMPLVTLSGGKADVADAGSSDPIMLPLEMEAAADSTNITCGYSYFAYLPDEAMPS